MRLRLAFALVALTALAACDQAPKDGARAPIGAAGAPVAATAPAPAVNCPTVQPACPTPKTTQAKAHRAQPKKAVRHAVARTKAPAVAVKQYAQGDAAVGLPPRPYRYDELYPAPAPPHVERRAGVDDGYRYERYERRWDDGGQPPAPPPRPLPPPPSVGHGYAQQGGVYQDQRVYEYRQPRQYESYSETRSGYVEQGGCCAPRARAAGFDSRGYLTWPGKVPPR